MNILALNSGSSSIKYRLFDAAQGYRLVLKGLAERIGQNEHRTAISNLFKDFKLKIDAVGHRIVHGGEKLRSSVLIDKDVIKEIKEAARFAPLHSMPNIVGIEEFQKLLPDIPQIAVFDTAAHVNLPPKAFLYALPMEYYQKHRIRKYGFHGINHLYVATEASKLIGKPLKDLKIITCHLGNGCSITAFEKGKSIDTSMGMTPLEGVVMGTRSGDLDPAVVLYLNEALGLESPQISDLLNKKSGLLGLCGKNDMRDILADSSKESQTAVDVFVYRIQKYIGAYIAALNGVDAIVFTGGIGENSPQIRSKIVSNFSYVKAIADPDKNEKNSPVFSRGDSGVVLLTIPANEERVIAEETYRLITRRPS